MAIELESRESMPKGGFRARCRTVRLGWNADGETKPAEWEGEWEAVDPGLRPDGGMERPARVRFSMRSGDESVHAEIDLARDIVERMFEGDRRAVEQGLEASLWMMDRRRPRRIVLMEILSVGKGESVHGGTSASP